MSQDAVSFGSLSHSNDLRGLISHRAGGDRKWPYIRLSFLAVVSIVVALLSPVVASAQDFRMETEVFVGNEPISDSLTLFTGDVVYDFLLAKNNEVQEITVFDIRRGKLTLLDRSRQVETSLTTDQLTEFSAAIKARGEKQGPIHLFQPRFETTFDAEQNRLTLASDRMTYTAKGVASRHPTGAQRYRQFADWYARLNAIGPGNVPPFGRLELNQALAERDLIPLEIERTYVVDRPVADKTLRAKSKHTVNWLITSTDQGRIEQAGHDLVKFREVSPSEYWSTPIKTARTK